MNIIENEDLVSSPADGAGLIGEPAVERLRRFQEDARAPLPAQVEAGFRATAAGLFGEGVLSMSQYVAVFGGEALHHLTYDGSAFRDMVTGEEAHELTAIYSRAKYGSVRDIRYLANRMVAHLSGALDNAESQWSRLFSEARDSGASIVMMTTGWRNVPSTANVLYDLVVDRINAKLALRGFPTIINVKLPRIAPPCENYASLSVTERARVNLVRDHVIPGANFYEHADVHVIFGDDVLITGATADKVFAESMRNGAKSFRAIYPVAIDPRVSLENATVEERLNTVVIAGKLDYTLAGMLSEPDYGPILRTLRLLFCRENRCSFISFLPQVPVSCWLRLYVSALGNDFLAQEDCRPSLVVLRNFLATHGLLDAEGMMTAS